MFTPSSFTITHSTIQGRDAVSISLGTVGLEPTVCFKGTTRRDNETAGEFTERVTRYVEQLCKNLNDQVERRTPSAQTTYPVSAAVARLNAAVAKAPNATTKAEMKKAFEAVGDAFVDAVGELVILTLTPEIVKKMETHGITKWPIEVSAVEPRTLSCFTLSGNFAFLPEPLAKSRDKSPETHKALLGSIMALQSLMMPGPYKISTL